MYFKKIMDFIISSAENTKGSDIPIAAAISIESEIVSSSLNKIETFGIPWFHAEFLAVQKALDLLDTKYLDNASLYVTLEPCAFCAALLERVRIKNIYFGAYNPKAGALFHNIKLFDHSLIKPEIMGGFQEEKCTEILIDFFKQLRY